MVSEYVGSGRIAELDYTLDQVARVERDEQRAELAALKQQLADPPELKEYYRLVRLLTHASLTAAGFRQHDRGEWRRLREA